MESKSYYDSFPEHLTADTQAIGELKKFAAEVETADRRQQVTLKASDEYVRRIRRTMLYHNKSYEDASYIVSHQDGQLMQLYCFGELKE